MASYLNYSCRPLLLLSLFGVCFARFSRYGVRSELRIFHHLCAMKKDEGPCKAMKDRFYFDIDTGRCEPFEYGGCQGNANNFETLQACEEMCLVTENKSPCHLEDEPGPCRGLVPRYFFDQKSQECKQFFYGGCFGNANNFKTIKECQKSCQPAAVLKSEEEEAKPVAESPAKHVETDLLSSLNDDAHLNSPHSALRRVSQPAEQEAEFSPPELCMSAVDRGDCDGSERRYVFNSRTGRCQAFRYTGCGGNKNNFIHKRHCMKMCMKDQLRRKQIRIKTRNSNILFRSV
ncbi:tissue factor pathway inhibitor a isoform X2 [Danio aesculapii]|uniref:tissue factor pathway inhibitor a isoform X2 n=1 Tax=Danio aesculapii TaxID=1142201 RepID=UPI0024BFBA17|nr:tissue factor pathway inhibitor a isoform X2 [Danio aesculapii]